MQFATWLLSIRNLCSFVHQHISVRLFNNTCVELFNNTSLLNCWSTYVCWTVEHLCWIVEHDICVELFNSICLLNCWITRLLKHFDWTPCTCTCVVAYALASKCGFTWPLPCDCLILRVSELSQAKRSDHSGTSFESVVTVNVEECLCSCYLAFWTVYKWTMSKP